MHEPKSLHCVVLECLFEGVRYPVNKKFVDSTCRGYCKCKIDGLVSCVSLCPPSMVRCEPSQKKVRVKEPVPHSNCTCDQENCVNIVPDNTRGKGS